jgi:putative lipase involved disintegration of autophagic bodies
MEKKSHLFKLFTNKCECFVYTFCCSSNCDNTLWTRSIRYVYFSTTLKNNRLKNIKNIIPKASFKHTPPKVIRRV